MGRVDSTRGIVRFGAFEVDFRAGELRKRGVKVKLPEQPLQILESLVQHSGEVVTREELKQKIWPADTFVDFEQGLYNAVRRLREALNDSAEKPRYIETLSKRGYRFVGSVEASIRKIESLAVLPLENMSRDPEQEYFAEGLTEALITTLAKIGGLRVASRTSAMYYQGMSKPLRDVAEELGVDAIVEGSVLRDGNRVRITAQLIDPGKESHIWAEGYERDLRDVLTLQAEIAQAIAREIQIKIAPQERTRLAQVHPVDFRAYEAYLQGRYYWNRRSGKGVGKAVQFFQQAIAKDRTYAAAYSGLADCLVLLGSMGAVAPADGCGKAKTLALKALALDSSLAEAHTSLAWATAWYDFDFATAEREFERSLELDPRYATGHEFFGWVLAMTGRFEEGYTEIKRAIRLDPLSSPIHFAMGCAYWSAHRFGEAITSLQKAVEFDSGSALAHAFLGYISMYTSQYERAIEEMREGIRLSQSASAVVASLGEVYAAAGKRDEAQRILDNLHQLSHHQYVSAYPVARTYMALGEKEEALRWLETAYAEHSAMMMLVKVDPRFSELHSDPRFQDILRRMNVQD
jgi:TolB-like protein/Tfp pilus assembly protein PilF